MDSKQIHYAMKNRLPVTCDGVQYDRILEYVSWYDKGGVHHLSAVLLLENCSVRVLADKVEMAI